MSTQQPGYPPPYQPLRRQRRIWPWVLIGVTVLIVGGCVAVLIVGKEIKDQVREELTELLSRAVSIAGRDSQPVTITYEITGTGAASNITYVKDVNLGQEQITAATLPWQREVKFGEGSIGPISLVAQAGEGNQEITCRILTDGREIAKSTSQGPYAVVACSGDASRR